jgi:hypothetical protein
VERDLSRASNSALSISAKKKEKECWSDECNENCNGIALPLEDIESECLSVLQSHFPNNSSTKNKSKREEIIMREG